LATDYTMCFDGVEAIKDEVAVPYASVFLSEKAILNQEPRHEVYALFKAEGIALKSGINLPEDHLSFELEFLAVLANKAADAVQAGDEPEALRCIQVSASFITEQILSWYDLLRKRALLILKTRFYLGVLKATHGYLQSDLDPLAALAASLGQADPDVS